jgi:hypothetical protein
MAAIPRLIASWLTSPKPNTIPGGPLETPQSIDATQMADTKRQTAGGKVLWHLTMSLDGFVARPMWPRQSVSGAMHTPTEQLPLRPGSSSTTLDAATPHSAPCHR